MFEQSIRFQVIKENFRIHLFRLVIHLLAVTSFLIEGTWVNLVSGFDLFETGCKNEISMSRFNSINLAGLTPLKKVLYHSLLL